MKIVIAGASGLIGRALVDHLAASGRELVVLTRSSSPAHRERVSPSRAVWDGLSDGPWVRSLDGAKAVINLSGESIAAGRWTAARKRRILESRVLSTRTLVSALSRLTHPPRVFINASAVGIYGDVPDGDVDESHAAGSGFLADVCRAWEAEAFAASRDGLRVVTLRTGILLDTRGGALPPLLRPFRFFAGGHLGDGSQWMPWIHRQDEIRAIAFILENERIDGAVNLTAPQPATMKELCGEIGTIIRRPAWTRVPAFVLRLALGEMAGPLLLEGQRALPEKLLKSGFSFRFPTLRAALGDLLGKSPVSGSES